MFSKFQFGNLKKVGGPKNLAYERNKTALTGYLGTGLLLAIEENEQQEQEVSQMLYPILTFLAFALCLWQAGRKKGRQEGGRQQEE